MAAREKDKPPRILNVDDIAFPSDPMCLDTTCVFSLNAGPNT